MYNKVIKDKYFEFIKPSAKAVKTINYIYSRMGKIEESLGKDVASFGVKEFHDAINDISGESVRSKNAMLHEFLRYIRWCVDNNIDGANKDLLVARFDYKNIENGKAFSKMVKDAKELQSILEQCRALNNVDTNYPGSWVIYETWFWVAFSGVDIHDAIRLTSCNIDIPNRVIRVRGNLYPLYTLALPVINMCIEAKELIRFYAGEIKHFQRDASELLLRTTTEPNLASLQANVSRYLKGDRSSSVKQISYISIRKSGVFFEAKLEEIVSGIEPDFYAIAKRDLEISKAQRGEVFDASDRIQRMEITNRANTLETDYLRWNKYFYELPNAR